MKTTSKYNNKKSQQKIRFLKNEFFLFKQNIPKYNRNFQSITHRQFVKLLTNLVNNCKVKLFIQCF